MDGDAPRRSKLHLGWRPPRYAEPPAPMIREAMDASAEERAITKRQGGGWPAKITAAALTLNAMRREFIAASMAFDEADTPATRRALAEAEWKFLAARHAYYEARARPG